MNDKAFLCSVDEAKRQVEDKDTVKSEEVFDAIPPASWNIERVCGREFEPFHATRIVYPSPVTVSPDNGTLTLRDPDTHQTMYLLALESVTNGSKALTVGTDVDVYDEGVPSAKLTMLTWRHQWTRGCGGCNERTRYKVSVTGWWGFRDGGLAAAWVEVDKLSAQMLVDAGQLAADGDVKAISFTGRAPRFSPGNLIRVRTGDDAEIMRVYQTDESHALNVLRAQKGTDAAQHEIDDPVDVWSVQPEVVYAAARWSGLLATRAGQYQNFTPADFGGTFQYPIDMPGDVQALLERWTT